MQFPMETFGGVLQNGKFLNFGMADGKFVVFHSSFNLECSLPKFNGSGHVPSYGGIGVFSGGGLEPSVSSPEEKRCL